MEMEGTWWSNWSSETCTVDNAWLRLDLLSKFMMTTVIILVYFSIFWYIIFVLYVLMPVTESEVSFQSLSTQPQDEPLHVDLRGWKRSTQCGLGISLDNSVLMLPVQQDTSAPHGSCDGIWLFQHLTWFLWMQNSAKTLRWSVVMYGFAARAYSSRASEICRDIIIGRCFYQSLTLTKADHLRCLRLRSMAWLSPHR